MADLHWRRRIIERLVVWALFACLPATGSGAIRTVSPGPDALVQAIAAADPGDTLRLLPGRYSGPITIDRTLALIGEDGSVIDGGGRGRVITVAAPRVRLRGLAVMGSGASLASEDSGIFVTPDADQVRIEKNRLQGNLIGIYLKGPQGAMVRGNTIIGRRDLRMNERGNGVQLWNTPGSIVAENVVRYGRDGVFVTTSRDNVFRGNRFRDLRYAIHYMYTNTSEISGNVSTGNHIGYALMFSHGLVVHGNRSEGDRDHGIMLNYTNGSDIAHNVVRGGRRKCVFIYNAHHNRIHGNHFEGCAIGIHFTAGSEGNGITGNAFIGNRTQVKYVGTRQLEWSVAGRGNYWSDHSAFDLDGDGIADWAYRPNDLVDQLIWRYPLVKLLLASPALHVLRRAQSVFPSLHPGGVSDSAPLMDRPVTERD